MDSRRPSTTGRHKSTSALHMERAFEEMRVKEAKSFLQPYFKAMRQRHSSNKGDSAITKRNLQKLACHWKLNQIPGFWAANPTEEALLATLYKHAKKLQAEEKLHPPPAMEDYGDNRGTSRTGMPDHEWEKRVAELSIAQLNYKGDLFGTRGNYTNGIIYASRRPQSTAELRGGVPSKGMPGGRKNSADMDSSEESDSEMETAPEESAALEELRLNSSATLAELSSQEEMKEKLATFETVQTLYETYTTINNRQIKRNCALTLANLYSSIDIASGQDDIMIPIIWLCAGQEEADVFTTCAKAILRRLRAERPLDKDYVKGIVAAVTNIENRSVVSTTTRRMLAEAIFLMLDRCQDTGEDESMFLTPSPRRRRRRNTPFVPPSPPSSPTPPLRALPPASPIQTASEAAEEAGGPTDEAVYEAVREGVLPLLVSMAGTDDDKIKEFVALSFFRISNLASTHGDLGGRLVLPAIISLLHGGTPRAMNTAAMLLFKLVMLDSTAQIYNMQIVVDAMVAVALRQGDTLDPDNQEEEAIKCSVPEFTFLDLARQASTTFLHLSRKPGMIIRLLQAGAADALFVWASSKDHMIHRNAILTLCFFYGEESIRGELVALGFIESMLEALNEDMELYKPPASYSSAMEAEGRLASSRGRSEEDEMAGYDVKSKIAHCLLDLTASPSGEVITELSSHNGIAALVSWYNQVKGVSYPPTAIASGAACIEALANLAKYSDLRPALASKDCIATLIEASQSKLEEIGAHSLKALSLLAAYPPAHKTLLESSIIPTLGALAHVPGKKRPIVSSLCELSHFRDYHSAMLEQQVIPLLVAQSRVNDVTIRRQCAQALYNLSCVMDASREYEMVRSQVSESLTIIALFRADDELTKDLCAAALYNMLFNPIGRLQMINDGVLWALIKLATPHTEVHPPPPPEVSPFPAEDPRSRHAVADVRYTCTRVIRNLACDAVLVKQLSERRVLGALEAFAAAPDHDTRLNCAVAVAEACRRPELHLPLLEHGVLNVLLALAKGNDLPVAHRVAVSALRLSQKPESREYLYNNSLLLVAVLGTLLRSLFPSAATSLGLSSRNYHEYSVPESESDAHDPSLDALLVRTTLAAVIALANITIGVPAGQTLAVADPAGHVASWVKPPERPMMPKATLSIARSLSIPASISTGAAALPAGFASSDAETKRKAKQYSVLQRLLLVLQLVLKISSSVPDLEKVQGVHWAINGSNDGLEKAVPISKEEDNKEEDNKSRSSSEGGNSDNEYSDDYSDEGFVPEPTMVGMAEEDVAEETDVQKADLQDLLGDFATGLGPQLFLVDAVVRCIQNSIIHHLPYEGFVWLAQNEPEGVALTIVECFATLEKLAPKDNAEAGSRTAAWNTTAAADCVRQDYTMLFGAVAWLSTHPEFAAAFYSTDILEKMARVAEEYPSSVYMHQAVASTLSSFVHYRPNYNIALNVLQRLCRLLSHAFRYRQYSIVAAYVFVLHTLAAPLGAPLSARFGKGALGSEDVEDTERRERNLGTLLKAGFTVPLTKVVLDGCRMWKIAHGVTDTTSIPSPTQSQSPSRLTEEGEGVEDEGFWGQTPEDKEFAEKLLTKCSEVVYEVVGIESLAATFVEDGGLPAIVAMGNTKIRSVQLQMIDLMLRLSKTEENRVPLLKAQAGPTLSALASKGNMGVGIQDKCAEALRNLSADDPANHAGGSVVDSVLMLLPGAPVREVAIDDEEDKSEVEGMEVVAPEQPNPAHFQLPRPVLPPESEAPVPATVEQLWLRYSSSGCENGRVPPLEEGVAEYAGELKALLQTVDPRIVYAVLGLDKPEGFDVSAIDGVQLITGSVTPNSPYFDPDRLHNWNKILTMEGPPVAPSEDVIAAAADALVSPFHVGLGDGSDGSGRRASRFKGLSRPLFISADAVHAASAGMRERRKVIPMTTKPVQKKTWRMTRSVQSLPPLNPTPKAPERTQSETVLVLSARQPERNTEAKEDKPKRRNRENKAEEDQAGMIVQFNRKRKPLSPNSKPSFRPGKPPSLEDTLKNTKAVAGRPSRPEKIATGKPNLKQSNDLSPYFPQPLPSRPKDTKADRSQQPKKSASSSSMAEREALWKQLENDLAKGEKLAAGSSKSRSQASLQDGSIGSEGAQPRSRNRPRTTASSDGDVIPMNSDGVVMADSGRKTPQSRIPEGSAADGKSSPSGNENGASDTRPARTSDDGIPVPPASPIDTSKPASSRSQGPRGYNRRSAKSGNQSASSKSRQGSSRSQREGPASPPGAASGAGLSDTQKTEAYEDDFESTQGTTK